MIPRVLVIAGSDSSGGAGIQADLKSIAACGGYAMTAITAITAQNTRGVTRVHPVPAEMLRAQLDAIADDIRVDAVKIGMLGSSELIATVSEWLVEHRPPLVVVDPVMVATSGDRLLDPNAESALRRLCAVADLVTPNLPELAMLADEPPAENWDAALAQAVRFSTQTSAAVVVKGGHLEGEECPDALVDAASPTRVIEVPGERITTSSTHGTGCSLSSALAVLIPLRSDRARALREAKTWLAKAIQGGPALGVGQGHGPVDHFAAVRALLPGADREAEGARDTLDPTVIAAQWWEDITDVRDAIDELPFVRRLADGTLSEDVFRHYLRQDALYLRHYSRALSRASRLAPTRDEQAFWAGSAFGALEEESRLHQTWLGDESAAIVPSEATRAYLDHLDRAGADYSVLVAALLPCFWIYQDVGTRLAAHAHDAHPFNAWLRTYADPAFEVATHHAIEVVTRTAAGSGAERRARMQRAFRSSSRHELAFFAQEPGPLGSRVF
ncbi:bifunctional hydroxymethylpyrimidine kinase/phosphomethylpyrimidine kinase [Rathayibacter sp. CAU 1779]